MSIWSQVLQTFPTFMTLTFLKRASQLLSCCYCSVAKSHLLFETPWTTAHQASLSFTISGGHSKWFSRWCYLIILSSTTLFSFCLQSFPASGSFPVSWLFTSGGHSIGASALATVLSVNIRVDLLYNWLISLLSKGLSRVSSSTIIQKHQLFSTQPFT